MAKKKPTAPKNTYQLYHRRLPNGPACPQHWWINNAAHYDLVAHLSAASIEEAWILMRHQDGAWYRQLGVTLVPNAPVRESRDGDVLVEPRQVRPQTWMLIAGSAVLLTEPQEQEVASAGQQQAIVAVCWSPDGKRFAACGKQGLVRVHTLGSPRDHSYDTHGGYAQSVAWSPDGKRIATGDGRDATHIWDVCPADQTTYGADAAWDRILICREQQEREWYKGTYGVAWSPDSRLVAAGNFLGVVRVWHAETGVCTYQAHRHQGAAVRAVAWSPDGTHLASVGDSRTVQVGDIYADFWTTTFDEPLGDLHALAWSPDGTNLLIGGTEQLVLHRYRATLERRPEEICLSRSCSCTGVHSVAYAPGGRYAVAGCSDGTVQVVDLQAGEHVHSYHGHTGPVRSVAWSPDGKHILSGGEDAQAFVWAVPASFVPQECETSQ